MFTCPFKVEAASKEGRGKTYGEMARDLLLRIIPMENLMGYNWIGRFGKIGLQQRNPRVVDAIIGREIMY